MKIPQKNSNSKQYIEKGAIFLLYMSPYIYIPAGIVTAVSLLSSSWAFHISCVRVVLLCVPLTYCVHCSAFCPSPQR